MNNTYSKFYKFMCEENNIHKIYYLMGKHDIPLNSIRNSFSNGKPPLQLLICKMYDIDDEYSARTWLGFQNKWLDTISSK